MQAGLESTQQTMPAAIVTSESPVSRSRPTPSQRSAFIAAIQNGLSARKASTLVGVSRETGRRWAKSINANPLEPLGQANILPKDKLAAKLSQDILDISVPAQHRATSGTLLAKLQGYISKEEASDPTQPRKALRDLAIEWYNERAALSTNATPAQTQCPPAANNQQVDISPLIGPCIDSAQPAKAEPGSPQASGDDIVQANSPPAAGNQQSLSSTISKEVGQ